MSEDAWVVCKDDVPLAVCMSEEDAVKLFKMLKAVNEGSSVTVDIRDIPLVRIGT